jgi:UDP-GlcNAc:undecaprenyl-phosphate GlcNAc-1-phosphate transferase
MITGLSTVFRAMLLAGALALLLSPAMIQLARTLGLLDRPGSAKHKLHQAATPTAGGLVILLAGSISVLTLPVTVTKEIFGILMGTLVVLFFGLVDDRINLRPPHKLLGQILGAVVVILMGVQVQITRITWIDLSLSVFWLVGITNAFNFVDSMDGLAAGLAGISSGFFMLVNIDSFQPELAELCAVLLGIVVGSFLFTSPPAKMFLGDSGAQALGIMLASIGIAYTPGQAGLPQAATWFVPILALGVPIFDMVLVVISRIRRKRPIYEANMDHTYHRLTRLGLHPNRSVLLMQVMAIQLSLIAFIALGTSVLIANVIFGTLILGSLLILGYLEFWLDGYVFD